jgi:pyruvate/2-oxoglutarate dehydrogenase complex dihydrolipoamide dehydrogenase (E3) component
VLVFRWLAQILFRAQSMTSSQQYDALVIGSGQAGKPLSIALAEAGMRTAIIEREHVGGTCVNEGCTPTKTMVASGRVAYLARRAADYGVQTGPISIDLEKVRQRKRDIVDSFRSRSQSRIEETANLDLIFGDARFAGSNSVEVRLKDGGQKVLSAKNIFINAGTRASRPRLDGLDNIPFLDNASIMELDSAPEHLLILGGGYIGLEFGQLFRRFGSRVTIIQSAGQLLTGEDPDIADEVAKIFREDGIGIVLKGKATRVSRSDGNIRLEVQQEGNSTTLVGSHLLVATGRTPNSDTLNLPAAGIQMNEHGFIQVNDRLETTADGVYALGDIKGGPAFTHISYDDFRIIRTNLLEKKTASIANRLVPYTLFIDPQLGRVGLTETEARAQSRNIRIANLPMTSVARALEVDETRGFMKAIVDGDTNQILGAAILGIEGGEVMSALEIAMMGKLPYTSLRDGVFAHPTLAESLNNLFMAMDSKK